MKGIKSSEIAFTYAGCVVGAGFLSGQELWQFFGSYGKWGFLGFVLSMILQAVLVYVVLVYAKRSQIAEFDNLIVAKDVKLLKLFFVLTEFVFIFSVVMIMFAGSGSLIYVAFGLNPTIGSLIFAVAVTFVAFLGIKGIVKVLSATIPLLTVVTLIISILALSKYGFPNVSNAEVTGKTLMMPNFIVAFILFSIHNIYCTLGVLAPLGVSMENDNTAIKGVGISTTVLMLIAVSVLMPIYSMSEFAKAELPMLNLAETINMPLFYIYAILLLIGMFGSAISHFVSITDFTFRKFEVLNKRKYLFILPVAISAFGLSMVGFSELISFFYPLSGYIGVIAFVLIIINFIKNRKKKL